MNKLKINILEDSQGENATPIIQAHSLIFNTQATHTNGNSLDEGNFTINGKRTLKLANNKTEEANFPELSVRLQEMEIVLSGMAEGTEKVKYQAKYDIWKTFWDSFQAALGTALVAQYILDNPAESNGE